jgi:hypothetical protein
LKSESKAEISVHITLIGMLIAMLTVGCGAGGPQETAYLSTSQAASVSADSKASQAQPSSDTVLGTWEGTTVARCPGSIASRCGAQQKVSITLREADNSTFTGSYACAYGNEDCYNTNNTGKVTDVTLTDSRITFRVIMPDATSCIFNGNVANNTINGGYACYNGGLLLEQGSWLAHRAS